MAAVLSPLRVRSSGHSWIDVPRPMLVDAAVKLGVDGDEMRVLERVVLGSDLLSGAFADVERMLPLLTFPELYGNWYEASDGGVSRDKDRTSLPLQLLPRGASIRVFVLTNAMGQSTYWCVLRWWCQGLGEGNARPCAVAIRSQFKCLGTLTNACRLMARVCLDEDMLLKDLMMLLWRTPPPLVEVSRDHTYSDISVRLEAGPLRVAVHPLYHDMSEDHTKIYQLVQWCGIKNLVTLVGLLLQEQQLVLISKFPGVCVMAAEALLLLFKPFTWDHVYIPFLHANQREVLEAPMPYLVGIEGSLDALPAGVACAHLDTGNVTVPEDVPSVPECYRNGIVNRLTEVDQMHRYSTVSVAPVDTVWSAVSEARVAGAFLEANIGLLSNIDRATRNCTSGRILFDNEVFMEGVGAQDVHFMANISNAHHFMGYISNLKELKRVRSLVSRVESLERHFEQQTCTPVGGDLIETCIPDWTALRNGPVKMSMPEEGLHNPTWGPLCWRAHDFVKRGLPFEAISLLSTCSDHEVLLRLKQMIEACRDALSCEQATQLSRNGGLLVSMYESMSSKAHKEVYPVESTRPGALLKLLGSAGKSVDINLWRRNAADFGLVPNSAVADIVARGLSNLGTQHREGKGPDAVDGNPANVLDPDAISYFVTYLDTIYSKENQAACGLERRELLFLTTQARLGRMHGYLQITSKRTLFFCNRVGARPYFELLHREVREVRTVSRRWRGFITLVSRDISVEACCFKIESPGLLWTAERYIKELVGAWRVGSYGNTSPVTRKEKLQKILSHSASIIACAEALRQTLTEWGIYYFGSVKDYSILDEFPWNYSQIEDCTGVSERQYSQYNCELLVSSQQCGASGISLEQIPGFAIPVAQLQQGHAVSMEVVYHSDDRDRVTVFIGTDNGTLLMHSVSSDGGSSTTTHKHFEDSPVTAIASVPAQLGGDASSGNARMSRVITVSTRNGFVLVMCGKHCYVCKVTESATLDVKQSLPDKLLHERVTCMDTLVAPGGVYVELLLGVGTRLFLYRLDDQSRFKIKAKYSLPAEARSVVAVHNGAFAYCGENNECVRVDFNSAVSMKRMFQLGVSLNLRAFVAGIVETEKEDSEVWVSLTKCSFQILDGKTGEAAGSSVTFDHDIVGLTVSDPYSIVAVTAGLHVVDRLRSRNGEEEGGQNRIEVKRLAFVSLDKVTFVSRGCRCSDDDSTIFGIVVDYKHFFLLRVKDSAACAPSS